MPELPEVESVVRALDTLLQGNRIASASLYREKLAPSVAPQTFETVFSNAGIVQVSRRGKYILIDLDTSHTLLAHLRMSGRFQLLDPIHENPKFTHAEFFLDDGRRLVFSDQRHFGYMNLVATAGLESSKELRSLAPEPLSSDFSKLYLRETLRKSGRSVKELLLDQTKVCGLGNIYASEALFLSRINPVKPAKRISAVKAHQLRENIRLVLTESIEFGSTGKIDPLNLESRYYGGDYEGEWRVYDRENQPCPNCGKPVLRIKQGGRSSYFCNRCQK